ncbi:MAG TPA: adenosylcobinamide-phosphate synthase CbiB [Methanocorpusculum sp.]|nr:adenosylcobinamide-phosphate synthase CbiB [Methanocorpusculum sp.]
MFGAVSFLAGLILDRIIGDPRSRFHPVALLGSFIGLWGKTGRYPKKAERLLGVIFWFATVGICLVPVYLIMRFAPWQTGVIFSAVLFSFCIGWRSLEEHVFSVEKALTLSDTEGRKAVSFMVSRDTAKLSHEQIRSAAYESAAENLVDSIIAPMFWFVVFELLFGMGILGAVLFRAANTMDAMLGYKDERIRLGWFSARADDVLAFLPARITGIFLLLYFLAAGKVRSAWRVFLRDRKKRPGFNGGIPMSLIAGGCGIQFDKPGVYQIGNPEKSLEGGGKLIISAMRWTTVYAAVFATALMIIPAVLQLLRL